MPGSIGSKQGLPSAGQQTVVCGIAPKKSDSTKFVSKSIYQCDRTYSDDLRKLRVQERIAPTAMEQAICTD